MVFVTELTSAALGDGEACEDVLRVQGASGNHATFVFGFSNNTSNTVIFQKPKEKQRLGYTFRYCFWSQSLALDRKLVAS